MFCHKNFKNLFFTFFQTKYKLFERFGGKNILSL